MSSLLYLKLAMNQWPLFLRISWGHLLPLAVSLYCAWTLRAEIKKHLAPAAMVMLALAIMTWSLSEVTVGYQAGELVLGKWTVLYTLPAFIAFAVAATQTKRIPSEAVWLTAFLPLWLMDIVVSIGIWHSVPTGLSYVGGAGMVDALLLTPLLAVLANELASLKYRFRKPFGVR